MTYLRTSIFLFGAIFTFGCSSGSSAPAAVDAAAETASETSVVPETGAPETSAETGGPGNESCAPTTTNGECIGCCAELHPEAYGATLTKLVSCACRAENCAEKCKDATCAAQPANPEPGSECDTCLTQTEQGTCGAEAAACAQAECAAFFGCLRAARCTTKPD